MPSAQRQANQRQATQYQEPAQQQIPEGPLQPDQYQRFNELLSKSQTEAGLTQDEYDELEDLHTQAETYATNWTADPEDATLNLIEGTQGLANCMRVLVDTVPAAAGLKPVLERLNSSLFNAGHAMIEPQDVPDMPAPPGDQGGEGGTSPGTGQAPVNRDVPYVSGDGHVGSTLNCTMGNWEGEPQSYEYQWKRDDLSDPIGSDSSYQVQDADVGHSVSCVVKATNAEGTTEAPNSNSIQIS